MIQIFWHHSSTIYWSESVQCIIVIFICRSPLLLLTHKEWKLSLQHSFKQDRQCSHKRNIEAPSFNHYCLGVVWRITHYDCVFVALVIQHGSASAVLNFNCYNSLPHYLINSMIFGKKLLDIKCALVLSTTVVWIISHNSKSNSSRYYNKRTHVVVSRVRYFCQILTKL
jgi:hypothetical protein